MLFAYVHTVIHLHIAMDKQANVNDALAYVESESERERE